MRHRKNKHQLGRDKKHRVALFRNLCRFLVEYGSLTTTLTKAKIIKSQVDRLMTKALVADLSSRRQLHRFFGKRDVVNTLCDRVAPLFEQRKSGFTTISKVGVRRGDNAVMAKLAFVRYPEGKSGLRSDRSKITEPATQPKKNKPTKQTATSTKVSTQPNPKSKKAKPKRIKSSKQ